MIKHWDLVPGEKLEIYPAVWLREPPQNARVKVIFRFRTTLLAYFERGEDLLSFELAHDGLLRERGSTVEWAIAGRNRETDGVEKQGAPGEGPHFTTQSRRALKG